MNLNYSRVYGATSFTGIKSSQIKYISNFFPGHNCTAVKLKKSIGNEIHFLMNGKISEIIENIDYFGNKLKGFDP